jgi:hypothetical protein
MTAPHPDWAPANPGLAADASLHLRFAITPIGPSLPPPAAGAKPVPDRQPDTAWHELTLSALLVCLAVDEAELAPRAETLALPDQGHPALSLAAPAWFRDQAADPAPLAPAQGLDEDWMKLLLGRPGLDAAWLLA